MSDVASRVRQCFLNVFPDLTEADVPRASQASLGNWDSVNHVTLLAAISEEFDLSMDDEAFELLTSYLLIVDFVESRVGEG